MASSQSLGAVPRFMSLWRTPKPVIAQVHGWCVGGGSDMALCADLVIASEDARIGTPYSRMWGCYLSGMWLYRLGLTRAKEFALTGRPLSGPEAAQAGLINAAVPFERLERRSPSRRARARGDPGLAAGGDEADRQPGLREHGPCLHADARADPRRPDAQHARRAPFIELAEREGVAGAVAARDGAFGDYSQAPPGERPDPANVIEP